MAEQRKQTSRIILHHSDSSRFKTTRANIDAWHRHFGWECIGYHYVITGDGKCETGRSLMQKGAHTIGANYDSIGICLTGDFMPGNDTMKEDDPQFKKLVEMLIYACSLFRIKADKIYGHKDWQATACPGQVYTLLPRIRELVTQGL